MKPGDKVIYDNKTYSVVKLFVSDSLVESAIISNGNDTHSVYASELKTLNNI